MKKRDKNILKHLQGEISLSTKVQKNKKKYSRKTKYKNKMFLDYLSSLSSLFREFK